jgi:hypothetical protein
VGNYPAADHSTTTLIVRSLRSDAPRSEPPCSSARRM